MATLRYSVLRSAKTTINIYNLIGEKIITVVDENKDIGNHETIINVKNLKAGIYFLQIKNAGNVEQKKIIVLK